MIILAMETKPLKYAIGHKDSIFACILDEQGKKILEKRFGI
jgi:hypothetical protein